MAKKKATSRPRRRATAAKRPASRRWAAPRSKSMSPLMSVMLGIGGAYAASLLANSSAVKGILKEDKMRAAAIAGAGVLGMMNFLALAPAFAGVAIAGGTTLIQMMAGNSAAKLTARQGAGTIKGIGQPSSVQIEDLKRRIREAQNRMNGIPRGVMTGIPSGVIVGAFDPDMPDSRFA